MGIVGGFERYGEDETMDGDLHWSALCEFYNGDIIPLEIGYDIEIKGL